jgi:hypothetical protein
MGSGSSQPLIDAPPHPGSRRERGMRTCPPGVRQDAPIGIRDSCQGDDPASITEDPRYSDTPAEGGRTGSGTSGSDGRGFSSLSALGDRRKGADEDGSHRPIVGSAARRARLRSSGRQAPCAGLRPTSSREGRGRPDSCSWLARGRRTARPDPDPASRSSSSRTPARRCTSRRRTHLVRSRG